MEKRQDPQSKTPRVPTDADALSTQDYQIECLFVSVTQDCLRARAPRARARAAWRARLPVEPLRLRYGFRLPYTIREVFSNFTAHTSIIIEAAVPSAAQRLSGLAAKRR